MKHRRHFGIANGVGPIGVARIDALVSDLDRRIQVLDCDIAAEEEHALVFNHAGYPIVARTLAARRDIRPPSPRSRSDLSAFRNGPTNFRPSGIGPCCRPGATRANSFSPIPMAGCVSPDHLSAPSATDVVFLTSALCQRTHASHARTRYIECRVKSLQMAEMPVANTIPPSRTGLAASIVMVVTVLVQGGVGTMGP